MRSSRYRPLAAGIGKRLSGASSITLDNQTYAPADLVKLFDGVADAIDATPPLKEAWRSSVSSAKSAEAKAHPVMVAFVRWLRATYGKEPAILQDFGLTVPAPRPVKVATKVKAQAKAKATRRQRHTAGKRQKQAMSEAETAPTTPVGGTPVKS